MLSLIADENFNYDIVRGLLRHHSQLNLVRVQDVGLMGADDPAILEWAAQENRILLTHDVATITKFAFQRIQSGQKMPGVIEIRRTLPVGVAIQELLLIIGASLDNEWEGQVIFLPLN